MKKKHISTLIGATAMSTAMLSGCNIEDELLRHQEMVLYGPPPVIREDIEEDDTTTETDKNTDETLEIPDIPEVDKFKPELEYEIEVYGPAPDIWN